MQINNSTLLNAAFYGRNLSGGGQSPVTVSGLLSITLRAADGAPASSIPFNSMHALLPLSPNYNASQPLFCVAVRPPVLKEHGMPNVGYMYIVNPPGEALIMAVKLLEPICLHVFVEVDCMYVSRPDLVTQAHQTQRQRAVLMTPCHYFCMRSFVVHAALPMLLSLSYHAAFQQVAGR